MSASIPDPQRKIVLQALMAKLLQQIDALEKTVIQLKDQGKNGNLVSTLDTPSPFEQIFINTSVGQELGLGSGLLSSAMTSNNMNHVVLSRCLEPSKTPRKPIKKTKMPVVCKQSQIKNILAIPHFWKIYDLDQIVAIAKENARQIASTNPTIGSKIINNCETEIENMTYIFESLQDTIWNLDLQFLNAKVKKRDLKNAKPKYRRRADMVIREVAKKKRIMIDQKIGILQGIAEVPFVVADCFRANPTLEEVNLF